MQAESVHRLPGEVHCHTQGRHFGLSIIIAAKDVGRSQPGHDNDLSLMPLWNNHRYEVGVVLIELNRKIHGEHLGYSGITPRHIHICKEGLTVRGANSCRYPDQLLPAKVPPDLFKKGNKGLVKFVNNLRKGTTPGPDPCNIQRGALVVGNKFVGRHCPEFFIGQIPEQASAYGMFEFLGKGRVIIV